MDGRIECIIRTCEDMSRVCTLDFNGSGDEYRSSNEIAYNKDIKRYLMKVYIKGHIRSSIGWVMDDEILRCPGQILFIKL